MFFSEMLNEVMLTEANLESSQASTMELFSLRLSYILKTYLIAFKFHFLHNSPKKTSGEKVFC